MVLAVATSIGFVVSLAIESIFLACVEYYHVEGAYQLSSLIMNNCHLKFLGKNSYKWWEKKTTIKFMIISIALLIWFVIIVEFGNLLFVNIKQEKLFDVCIYLEEDKFQLEIHFSVLLCVHLSS